MMTRNGTALTIISRATGPQSAGGPVGRAEATFTTHLLAIRLDSPEFRQRRRIDPALGVAAYRVRLGQTGRPAAAAVAHA